MQCSQETIGRLFYNVSSSFFLFLLFFYFTSILLSKFFQFFGTPIFQRNQDGYEFNMLSEEEEEEEEEDNSYFHGGDVEMMIRDQTIQDNDASSSDFVGTWQSNPMDHEPYEAFLSPASSESKQADDDDDDEENNEIPSCDSHADVIPWPTQNHDDDRHHKTQQQPENRSINHHEEDEEEEREKQKKKRTEEVKNIKNRDDDHEPPTNTESRKLRWKEEEENSGVVFGDACTVGSISRDSSEWRDSSYTEDPFSSSSRRSCFKWESYPIFQKYEDEMLFFDRIIWEKLQESETLKYIQPRPKSMSKRIVHIFIPGTKHSSSSTTNYHRRQYHELESAYVAQICLTWEALSWNYNYFCRLKSSRRDEADPGCPAYVAQQFQQFQVLLQRYNETEPYERGKRPEIYTRKRVSSPKLLQVPEYRDSNDEERESLGPGSRIPSNSFLVIMEESIKTFMGFLKADKQSRISKVVLFEKTRIRTDHHHHPTTDPTRILSLKKVNKKKKRKVKEIKRGGHRWTFKKTTRECRGEEEMEILMSLIDLKVVERVLRMGYEFEYLGEEKLQWCEEKMKKVSLMHNGKVKRDSSTSPPLLFPAAVHHNQH